MRALAIFTHFYLANLCAGQEYVVNSKLQRKLNAVERNAECCMNKETCCDKSGEKATHFEVKSVLTDCPKKACNYTSNQIIVTQKNKNYGPQGKLTDCIQKLLITIKVINEGITNDKSQYVIIDHVTDPNTMKKIRIMNPFAIRIRQKPAMMVYGLQFERAVNAEAKEMVHNNHQRSYRGCNLSPDNPTCGAVKHNGRPVPYSTGFCCSCDNEKNYKMEQELGRDDLGVGRWPFGASLPAGDNKNAYKANNADYGFIGGPILSRADRDVAGQSSESGNFQEIRRQRRGGQSCEKTGEIPQFFQESTHCLKFSNLWYSVYRLNKPTIVHKLKIQIFQKYDDCQGNTHWIDLTKGQVIHLGTSSSSCDNPVNKIIARYKSDDIESCQQNIDFKSRKLLIPEKRVADPEKFLLIPKSYISAGRTCNTAGVGYEAFYKQIKRCANPKGTCLQNQPLHFFRRDTEAESEGQRGDYFLKFFGTLADDPITYNSTGQIQDLRMVYTQKFTSTVFLEMNADSLTLLQPNSFATITEIYTDATNIDKTKIIVKVTNSGLLYGIFYVRLTGCPLYVPASFNNIASKSVLIAPQHQHSFHLHIEYTLKYSETLCRIQVHNIYQELLAFRQIRIEAYDRCICIWYCECACYVADDGLTCIPLPIEQYHSAGFQGGFPFPSSVMANSWLDILLALFFHMFIYLILTLLIMGLIKALLGMCSRDISLWGLNTIIGTDEYSSTVCDNKDCQYRQENSISLPAQFCLNLVFFFVYPLVLINIAIRNCCFSSYTMEDESCSCEQRWIDYENCETSEPGLAKKKNVNSVQSSGKTLSMNYTSESGEKSTPRRSMTDLDG